ncbi:MAG: 1-deoxy-D-xylulose-5-phosphate synthase [Phycisphaerae bacterium]|nr:1-deoxy-D-xylulose-5-phosphate synthase [Phycisphaerae bacterium]
MSLLDRIASPDDLRALSIEQLVRLAEDIRLRVLEVVGKRGGHLTSNLGVTELTLALHRVFDFTADRFLLDVGHQCYPHKLITGRNGQFDQLRQSGGVSGFPEITESPYDLFNVGHAGTAVATAVGLARADEVMGRDTRVVALVGDASIVNGLAFEGLNQAGLLKRQFLVVLNDNEWGISPTQGGFAEYLAKFRASTFYEDVKDRTKQILPRLPILGQPMFDLIAHLKEGIKATVSPGQIFEALGFQYVGPVDGHDIGHLVELLELLKDVRHPVLLHAHTVKGKGCDWATAEPGRYHSPKPFAVEAGKVRHKSGKGKSWTRAFVECLSEVARRDDRVFAMTAGMPDGTGLLAFGEEFPGRWRDMGIAESCTVDVAAGMCKGGMRPVVAVYSTFLQRAFDQVFQEVALQGLPVIFCLDRAGLVGGDGAVHHGFLDITYLRGLPGMVLMAPLDEVELLESLHFALTLDRPCAIRYPRDDVPAPMPDCPKFELGRSRRLRDGSAVTILSYGATATCALSAAEMLSEMGIDAGVVAARFAKPVDRDMVSGALADGRPVVTVEDHSVAGGFGSAVLETAQELGLDASRLVRLGMPADRFISFGSRSGQLAECGYDATGIAATVQRLVESSSQDAVLESAVADIEPRSKSRSRRVQSTRG